jgi:signal transduction histidine kinase
MEQVIVGLLYVGMVFVLVYYYFCRLAGAKFKWYFGAAYGILSCGLALCRHLEWTTEFLSVCLGILLLTGFGMLFQKLKFTDSIGMSSLVISLYSIVAGMMQSVAFWIVASIPSIIVLHLADFIQSVFVVTLFIFTCRMVLKAFPDSMHSIRYNSLPMLLIPILFITLFEAFLTDFIYGNTIVWDSVKGLTYPVLNHFELLALRLLACGGLICSLIAYKKLTNSIEHEQTIRLLKQQAQNQEVYVNEAKSRYERTGAFRHDLQNHLLVLRQLLKEGKAPEANEYLEKLESTSISLSFPVHTGNTAVDALLGSKLSIAAQKGIPVTCSILIPKQSLISDMDWCIVISNAIDNAIKASAAVSETSRRIVLSGIRKGNIYLLNVENNCQTGTAAPTEGIGLSNIRAVLKKYNGNMDVEVADNTFQLNMLFVIPQHPNDIPQQSY